MAREQRQLTDLAWLDGMGADAHDEDQLLMMDLDGRGSPYYCGMSRRRFNAVRRYDS